MKTTALRYALVGALAALGTGTASASDAILSVEQQDAISDQMIALLQTEYVLPDRAERYAAALDAQPATGPLSVADYIALTNGRLQAVAPDRHLGLLAPDRFAEIADQIGVETPSNDHPDTPGSLASPSDAGSGHAAPGHGHGHAPSADIPASGQSRADREARNRAALREIAGISGVSEISRDGLHQLGYIAFERLVSGPRVERILTNILSTFTESDRLVFDLRECRGGDVEAVRFLSNFLFETPTHLVSTTRRHGGTEERWTVPHALSGQLSAIPVEILISDRTFSACESFAFGLRTTGRARLLGQNSGGGGHMNGFYALPEGLGVSISVGRTFDPRSGEGWEAAGLVPDVRFQPGHALSGTAFLIREESGLTEIWSADERAIYEQVQSYTRAWYEADADIMAGLLAPDFEAIRPESGQRDDRDAHLAATAGGAGVLPRLFHNRILRDVRIDGDHATATLVLRTTVHALSLIRNEEGWRVMSDTQRPKTHG